MSITVTCVIARKEFCSFLHAIKKQLTAKPSERNTATRLRFKRASWIQAVVFLQHGAELVVRQGNHFMIFDSSHRFRGDHCVDDRFFRRLNRRGENRLVFFVSQHLQIHDVFRRGSAGVRRGKRNEDVSRTVAGNASVPSETKRNAPRQPLQLVRHKRRIRRHDNDDGAVILIRERSRRIRILALDFPADGNSRDAQILPRSVVTLHQHADRILPAFRCETSRRCANASFESVANHPCAAANRAFLHCSGLRGIDGAECVLGLDVKAVNIVEPAIPSLCLYGERPPIVTGTNFLVLDNPLNHGVADNADAVRVRDHHGADQKTGFFDPRGSGHFAVPVQGPPPGHHRIVEISSARKNRGDSRAHRSFSNNQFPFAGNQGSVTDEDTGNIGDGILWPGRAVKRNTEIACTRFCFFLSLRKKRKCENTKQKKTNTRMSTDHSCLSKEKKMQRIAGRVYRSLAENTCSKANSRERATSCASSEVRIKGGARRMWSPRTPSTQPWVG